MNIILGSVSIVIAVLGFLFYTHLMVARRGWQKGYSEGHKAADNWWIGAEAEAHTMRQQIWKDEARL